MKLYNTQGKRVLVILNIYGHLYLHHKFLNRAIHLRFYFMPGVFWISFILRLYFHLRYSLPRFRREKIFLGNQVQLEKIIKMSPDATSHQLRSQLCGPARSRTSRGNSAS